MARKITVSICSGDRPMEYKGKKDPKQAVAVMKQYWEKQMQQAVNDCADMILLPEKCDRFLHMENEFNRAYDQVRMIEMPLFFKKFAKTYGINVLYSSKSKNTNSTFVINDKGIETGRYDKVFPMIEEMEEGIVPGKKAKVFPVGKIQKAGFAICFDLNFEELKEAYCNLQPEVMFFSSMFHGGIQQKIWAYQTRSFFVSSIYGQQSRIIAPNGRVLASTSNYNTHCSGTINLDSALIHLDRNIEKFGDIKAKYRDSVVIDDTGYLGSVMLYNENNDCTIRDIINEFELIPLDEYFEKVRRVKKEKFQ